MWKCACGGMGEKRCLSAFHGHVTLLGQRDQQNIACLKRHEHRSCSGFGTVRYKNREEALQAAEMMNNTEIGGRVVSVRIDRFA